MRVVGELIRPADARVRNVRRLTLSKNLVDRQRLQARFQHRQHPFARIATLGVVGKPLVRHPFSEAELFAEALPVVVGRAADEGLACRRSR